MQGFGNHYMTGLTDLFFYHETVEAMRLALHMNITALRTVLE